MPTDDVDRLTFVARRRGLTLAELVAHLLGTWIAGPGLTELVDAVAGEPREPVSTGTATGTTARPRGRRRTPRKAGVPGQLALVDEDYPPF
jgi:hypothetical protein